MNHKERLLATINREEVDRPASFLGMPTAEGWKSLLRYFDAASKDEVRTKTGDDIYPIDMPYHSPIADSVACALNFTSNERNEHMTLTEEGFFANKTDPDDVRLFDWPDPAKYIKKERCEELIANAPEGYPIMGVMWSAHFQDACSAFGMEKALMNMLLEPDMYEAVDNRITEFYLRANEVFFEYCKGKLDIVLIGNDMGTQRGLMMSPNIIREFVMPNSKRLVEQAHSYGAKVMYHSCGSIVEVIPEIIGIGVDVIHPIQALAAHMNAENLKENFYNKVSFCGGVDTQELLVTGTADDVKADVRRLRELFPTGLIISPSHEALQEDVKPENILALFEEANRV
jgi:uroporphyrinogen decarboxylase